MHLKQLKARLFNSNLTAMEKAHRRSFVQVVRDLDLPAGAIVLSISTGDAFWDYMVFSSNNRVRKIVATDIVDFPDDKEGLALLREKGEWEFVKTIADSVLPFGTDEFDMAFHQDVLEHTWKPFAFLSEQFRVLKPGGKIVFGTPNLLRPANLCKLLLGHLHFPLKLGWNYEIGDYTHVQEFNEWQIKTMLSEIGFVNIKVHHSFFGLHFCGLAFSNAPTSNIGKLMAHYLICEAEKPKRA